MGKGGNSMPQYQVAITCPLEVKEAFTKAKLDYEKSVNAKTALKVPDFRFKYVTNASFLKLLLGLYEKHKDELNQKD
jgi:hypothetical protein